MKKIDKYVVYIDEPFTKGKRLFYTDHYCLDDVVFKFSTSIKDAYIIYDRDLVLSFVTHLSKLSDEFDFKIMNLENEYEVD